MLNNHCHRVTAQLQLINIIINIIIKLWLEKWKVKQPLSAPWDIQRERETETEVWLHLLFQSVLDVSTLSGVHLYPREGVPVRTAWAPESVRAVLRRETSAAPTAETQIQLTRSCETLGPADRNSQSLVLMAPEHASLYPILSHVNPISTLVPDNQMTYLTQKWTGE
jgi:hypothetical protein